MVTKRPLRPEAISMLVHLPLDTKPWLEQQAELNRSTQNSEIIRAVRAKMDQDQSKRAAG
jgi:hypothetical protein